MTDCDPRSACIEALVRWEGGYEFADAILHQTVAQDGFSALDRTLFTEIFYGVIRWRRTLDTVIARLSKGDLDARTRQVLRLGVYQLRHMRIPAHAAVHETVEIAGRAKSMVNAVLRRLLREEAAVRKDLENAPLGIRTSHPDLLVRRWARQFGNGPTQRLCAWNNQPAEVFVRVNELKVTAGELLRTAEAEPVDLHPLMFRVRRLPLSWIVAGACYVQDPSTLLACELLAPKPGESVLDACAAPGGKTSCLAQMMRNEGRIVACDVAEKRLARLRENLARLGVANTTVRQVDWLKAPLTAAEAGTFDRILLDAPCSNTGVLRRRVDARWRLTEEDFTRMPEVQFAMIRNLAGLLKPGGTMVYSTCSLEREENEAVAERAAKEVPGLRLVRCARTLPFRENVDGAFAAKFRRD